MQFPQDIPDTSELWHLTMKHSPVGMALVSPSGEFVACNDALCEMLGRDADGLASLTVQAIAHPDDFEDYRQLWNDLLAGQVDSYRGLKRYLRADGSNLIGELSVVLLRDQQGEPIHLISQIVDLSERRAVEARLEQAQDHIDNEQRKAEAVFDTVAVGLLFISSTGVYETYNKRQHDFLDLAFPDGHKGQAGQPGFVFGADQAQLLSREEMPSSRAASGEEFADVLIWVGAEPEARRALSVSARSVRDRDGKFAGAALAYQDVTQLMRAIKVKDDFVGSVSHELRTPLTAALAYLELLDGTDGLPPGVGKQISAVRRNALRLSHLVADLLFTTRVSSGSSLIVPFRVDLVMTVTEAVNSARVDADGAGVHLAVDVPDALIVVVDGLRLRQVADNLIANAIQYTPTGGRVDVSLRVIADQVELLVADTGEGIDASDLNDIFARFFRGQNARRRLSPGTGLGLNIVRTIVEAHGGDVTIESAVGQGTTVRVLLPL